MGIVGRFLVNRSTDSSPAPPPPLSASAAICGAAATGQRGPATAAEARPSDPAPVAAPTPAPAELRLPEIAISSDRRRVVRAQSDLSADLPTVADVRNGPADARRRRPSPQGIMSSFALGASLSFLLLLPGLA